MVIGSEPREPVIVPVPANALVVLVGASGSGKSSWAAHEFAPTQVVSSDRCRALVADDEADQTVNREAFAVFYEIVRRRLALGRLTVADSTSLVPFSRERLRNIGARAGAPVLALVFRTPLPVLLQNNRRRDRVVPEPILARHAAALDEILESGVLLSEGYAAVHLIEWPLAARAVVVEPVRVPRPEPPPDLPT